MLKSKEALLPTKQPNGRYILKKRCLTEQESVWVNVYLQTGNASEATRASGMEEMPHKIKKRLNPFIQKNLHSLFEALGPAAFEKLMEIAFNCPEPAVQLKAIEKILSLGKYDAPVKHEVTIEGKSDRELDTEIKALLSKGNVIDAEVL